MTAETDSYDFSGNFLREWVESAEGLLAALQVLRAYSSATANWSASSWQLLDEPRTTNFPTVLMPQLLLTGYTMEVLLKCVLLTKGKVLAKDGKYVGPPTHNLLHLAGLADRAVTEIEKPILGFLSLVMGSIGRYPVGMSVKTTPFEWEWGTGQERVAQSFINSLVSYLFDWRRDQRKRKLNQSLLGDESVGRSWPEDLPNSPDV
jgi:hypothetical protein